MFSSDASAEPLRTDPDAGCPDLPPVAKREREMVSSRRSESFSSGDREKVSSSLPADFRKHSPSAICHAQFFQIQCFQATRVRNPFAQTPMQGAFSSGDREKVSSSLPADFRKYSPSGSHKGSTGGRSNHFPLSFGIHSVTAFPDFLQYLQTAVYTT
jgi:hypothetical protein